MKNKKAVELSLNVVIIAVILLVVVVVVLAVFGRLFGKEAEQIEKQIEGIGDKDGDGVIDIFDKCPNTEGTSEFKGCSSQSELDEKIKQQ